MAEPDMGLRIAVITPALPGFSRGWQVGYGRDGWRLARLTANSSVRYQMGPTRLHETSNPFEPTEGGQSLRRPQPS